MLNPSSMLATMMRAPARPGIVVWIGVRPARREDMQILSAVQAQTAHGLNGDRYKKSHGDRQVTLIEHESLMAIASHLDRNIVWPHEMRRNIVTKGINLLALKGRRFRIGEAIFEASGECHPCSRMEETFGLGGYNAARGFGGITARVVEGGEIRIGDTITTVDEKTDEETHGTFMEKASQK